MAAHIEWLALEYDVTVASMAHALLDLGLREALAEPMIIKAVMHKKLGG